MEKTDVLLEIRLVTIVANFITFPKFVEIRDQKIFIKNITKNEIDKFNSRNIRPKKMRWNWTESKLTQSKRKHQQFQLKCLSRKTELFIQIIFQRFLTPVLKWPWPVRAFWSNWIFPIKTYGPQKPKSCTQQMIRKSVFWVRLEFKSRMKIRKRLKIF